VEGGENRIRGGKPNTLSELKKHDREDERMNKSDWGKVENNWRKRSIRMGRGEKCGQRNISNTHFCV